VLTASKARSIAGFWGRDVPKIPKYGGQKMNLKPLDDRIVVKPNAAEERTASGLVIPDTAKEKPQQGTVLAVGPGRWSDDEGQHFALDIKVGDTVLYSKYGGTEITHGGDDLLILSSRDVLAIVTK
jgi:chaperonin GroES